MLFSVRYRCRNCGERFEATVLTAEEVREAERRRDSVEAVYCPRCHRTDIEKGW